MAIKRRAETYVQMKRAVYAKPSAGERASISAMPIRVIQLHTGNLFEVKLAGDRFNQSKSSEPAFKGNEPGPNPWRMRAAFDRISLPSELASFLRICGRFKLETDEQEISWPEFQEWQRYFRERAQGETPTYWTGWPCGVSSDSVEKIAVRPDAMIWCSSHLHAPLMAIHCQTTLEAIAATIFVDGWNGVKYGRCEWCGSLYAITTLHKRRYCTPAHLRLALRKRERSRTKQEELALSEREGGSDETV